MSFDHTPLGELVSITSGRRNSSEADSQGRYPFFTCGKEVLRINDYEHDREAVLLGGNNANAVFPVFYVNGAFTARQRVYVIWSADAAKLSNRYLYYVLSHLSATFTAKARGTTTLFITLPMLKELSIPLPDLAVQARIASFLSALDDRITILRETNATLEAIAQALFKSWFVDFDPVRAKRDGRPPDGMDEATAALFPDSFEDSELGEVPSGWSVQSLDGIAIYLNGLALQKFPPESDDEYLPVVKIAQLRAGNTTGADRASARLKPEYVVQDGDVLFSWSGSLEVEFWCGGDGALNQHLFKVTSNLVPKWFYYLATRHFLPSFREIAAHKATTMGHIQRKHLTEAKLALPSREVIKTLGMLIGPILDRRIRGALQARELANLRDTLLPRLISGQLRLPETAESPEEALT
ncbi:restriction endonuclease subunit S [Pelomonas sp. V22]|uniref:restriction endonuclease subunit S n=1 Tax=Pelomonas sp. V22 TaxID=2822139 RepID=UPI0024A7FDAC|nr:restriction endonuclease subunit S [Pelomonas sp. V22]